MASRDAVRDMQLSMLFQASEDLGPRLSSRARALVLQGTVAACALMAAGGASAQWTTVLDGLPGYSGAYGANAGQRGPINPSSCAQVGGAVAGAVVGGNPYGFGGNYALESAKRQVGELAGRALGHAACRANAEEPRRDDPAVVASRVPPYGGAPQVGETTRVQTGPAGGKQVVRTTPPEPKPPTLQEVDELSSKLHAMTTAQVKWEGALLNMQRAKAGTEGHKKARDEERAARDAFRERRLEFAIGIDEIGGGPDGKDVDRYYRTAAAALEFPVDGSISTIEAYRVRAMVVEAKNDAFREDMTFARSVVQAERAEPAVPTAKSQEAKAPRHGVVPNAVKRLLNKQ